MPAPHPTTREHCAVLPRSQAPRSPRTLRRREDRKIDPKSLEEAPHHGEIRANCHRNRSTLAPGWSARWLSLNHTRNERRNKPRWANLRFRGRHPMHIGLASGRGRPAPPGPSCFCGNSASSCRSSECWARSCAPNRSTAARNLGFRRPVRLSQVNGRRLHGCDPRGAHDRSRLPTISPVLPLSAGGPEKAAFPGRPPLD
jgi:hypothetical protein